MRYFITSDIHSYYSVLKKELDKLGFDKEKDTLITLGDNFDRGDESWKMYRFLYKLPNVILVKGNHEDLLVELVERGYSESHDWHNKTSKTIYDIYKHYLEKDEHIWSTDPIEKIRETEFYRWITSNVWVDKVEFNNLILTHATIPNELLPTWKDARWANPLINRVNNKILICGHWFAYLAKKEYNKDMDEDDEIALYHGINLPEHKLKYFYEPYIDKDLIMIDACTPLTKRCNVLIYDDEKEQLFYDEKVIIE